MKAIWVFVIGLAWTASLLYNHKVTKDFYEGQPIQCKSPIEPTLDVVEKDGELDTTWVYVRNIEQP